MKKIVSKMIIPVVAILSLVVLFQNCAQKKFTEEGGILASKGGDSYPGKLDAFVTVDASNPCQKISSQGQPFPSREIFLTNGTFSLVRDKCQDMEPIVLDPALVKVLPGGTSIVYQGDSFDLTTDLAQFNQTIPACPAGKTVINSSPTNIFSNFIDLSSNSWRAQHPDMPAVLDGALAALPRFFITPNDPANLDIWRRVSQIPILKPNTQYSMSFLIEQGSVNQAFLMYFENDGSNNEFDVVVDMSKLTTSVTLVHGLTGVQAVVKAYGSGALASVIFTTTANPNPAPDLGVSPYRANNNGMLKMGDSIFATAGQLAEVSTFCSP